MIVRSISILVLVALLPFAAQAQPEKPATYRTGRWDAPPKAVKRWLERALAHELSHGPVEAGEGLPPPTFGRRVRGAARGTARLFFDPTFAGGIVLADLADARLHGDRDKAWDTVTMLETPEFWIGIGM